MQRPLIALVLVGESEFAADLGYLDLGHAENIARILSKNGYTVAYCYNPDNIVALETLLMKYDRINLLYFIGHGGNAENANGNYLGRAIGMYKEGNTWYGINQPRLEMQKRDVNKRLVFMNGCKIDVGLSSGWGASVPVIYTTRDSIIDAPSMGVKVFKNLQTNKGQLDKLDSLFSKNDTYRKSGFSKSVAGFNGKLRNE